MEEKILIKSEQYNVKKLFRVMTIIGVVLTILILIIGFFDEYNWIHMKYPSESTSLLIKYTLREMFFIYYDGVYLLGFIPVVAFTLIGGLIYLWLRSYELTVTDKRVYGKVAWGKRVDLPIDSISATATHGSKGVSVSTSSGRISFRAIKNASEIYTVINNLLIERQQKAVQNTGTTIVQNSDEADQIKKYKSLLDSGVITQEEFDAKKKQLLGL